MSEVIFKCTNCGGNLEFSPGQQSLKCPFCGVLNQIETPSAPTVTQEVDFDAAVADFDRLATEEVKIVTCSGCGASVTFAPNATSGPCDFCGMQIVSTGETTKAMKPQYLIPFKLTREDSTGRFRTWIKKRWFAPNALKKYATITDPLKGIYFPFFTFDSQTATTYRGERGTHYFVPVSVRDSNGRMTTRQEMRTRWSPASGSLSRFFDDVLVPASRSIPEKLTRRLDDWKLGELVTYNPAYLSGFKSETYSVGLRESFDVAKQMIDAEIYRDVTRDIGGDEQRVHTINTRYSKVTFKYIQLPVWTLVYRFGAKYFQVLVNAQTGEVEGNRPYSVIKILLAILAGCVVVAGGIILYMFASGQLQLP
jgi:predicted RNA-binding Zn-ribbon protein involved in translation (DUF1610 family)